MSRRRRPVVVSACPYTASSHLDHVLPGSQEQDVMETVAAGLNNPPRGERAATHVLTEGEVREIRGLGGAFTQAVLAARYGVRQPQISKILARRAWSHI
jgi:hypothetical protein